MLGQSPRAGRFAGFSASRRWSSSPSCCPARWRALPAFRKSPAPSASCSRSISPGYGFTAIIVAFLGRLNPLGIIAAGLVLALTYLGGEAAQIALGISDKVARVFQGMLLFFVLGCDTLIHYRIRYRPAAARARTGEGGLLMDIAEAILLTIATAATPLLIAAIGELVVERSGVLNLGVEGMMVMGAVCGFGAALTDRLALARRARRRSSSGALFSLLFAFLTLTLATNQVATGLSLTLLGLGLSGMIGEAFFRLSPASRST